MLLEKTFFNNSVTEWVIAATLFILVFLLMRTLKATIYKQVFRIANKTDRLWDDVCAELKKYWWVSRQRRNGICPGCLWANNSSGAVYWKARGLVIRPG